MAKVKLGRDKYLSRKAVKEQRAQKILSENEEKANHSIVNINVTNTTIFVLSQCLIDHIDRLTDEDHNYSRLKLGKSANLVKQELKQQCNKFLKQLTKTVDNDKQVFTEQYIDDLDYTIGIFNTIGAEFGLQNVERLHAIAQVIQEDKPDALIKYYNKFHDEKTT